jgi:Fe-S-cluster containining protein
LEEFTCLKCGRCCHDLFDDRDGNKRGLILTTNETSLFPNGSVAPLAAFGFQEPSFIFLYQLSVIDCPHINQKNECMIYERRPLVCRSFPLTQGSFSTKCKLFHFLRDFPENSVKVLIDWGITQLEAEQQLDGYIVASYRKNFQPEIGSWSYDLADSKWRLKKRCCTINDTIEF